MDMGATPSMDMGDEDSSDWDDDGEEEDVSSTEGLGMAAAQADNNVQPSSSGKSPQRSPGRAGGSFAHITAQMPSMDTAPSSPSALTDPLSDE